MENPFVSTYNRSKPQESAVLDHCILTPGPVKGSAGISLSPRIHIQYIPYSHNRNPSSLELVICFPIVMSANPT
ncbi:hypothetical protein VTL71DRAFT_4119 [Oculimacula yallundae]|uniref:Uncharacterized protein n=1 Tax=Oculimacula yallundae TaxID=86028 RepID=A0ABR4C4Z4_9HELO